MGNEIIGLLLLTVGLTVHQFETIIVRRYGRKYGNGGMFFNAIICLFATLYFFVTDKGGLCFPPEIWAYGFINSLMYAAGFYSAYVSFKVGPFGITRLLTSFGVIILTFYGIFFLHEPTTPLTYLAIAMIVISLFLMNYQKPSDSAHSEFSVKWLIAVLITIATNAIISIIGKEQHNAFGDAYNNEFLIISLAGASVALFILGIILERDTFKDTFKYGLLYGAAVGIFNGTNNLLILVVYNYLPISVASPVRSGLGVGISIAVSALVYKEKFSRSQMLSVVIGLVAVVLINLKI